MKPGIYLTAKEILKLKTELPPIKKVLDEIYNPEIKVFTQDALERAPKQFWTYPCSKRSKTEGIEKRKYHAPFNLVEPGGIINHSVVCAYCALEGLKRYTEFRKPVADWRRWIITTKWSDLAISAALLHDICKNGDNITAPWGEQMHPRHGELAVEFLVHLPSLKAVPFEDIHEILCGTMWHMGNFGPLPSSKKFSEFELVIQEADFYSTRVFLENVDIELINYPPKDP